MGLHKIRALVENFPQGSFVPDMEKVVATYRFDIDDEGSWLVAIDHGRVSIRESHEEAGCVIGCSEDDYFLIIDGQLNLLTACMQGRLRIHGDPVLVMWFRGGFVAKRVRRRHAERPDQHP
jgi:putative sterol carrier protein